MCGQTPSPNIAELKTQVWMPVNFKGVGGGGGEVKTTPMFFMCIAIFKISSAVIVDKTKLLKSFYIGYVKWN